MSINDITLIGKTATLSMWCLVAYGLLAFSPEVSESLNLLASITLAMHVLMAMLAATILPRKNIISVHYGAILLFGLFAILDQYHSQNAD
ncbi:hypothetical protein ABIS04_01235 [Shewanella sp. H8]|uniref:hypothetical protein n=1 Tax=Shewanella sp. H8 TaxID=3342676 RepID=UPI003315AB59